MTEIPNTTLADVRALRHRIYARLPNAEFETLDFGRTLDVLYQGYILRACQAHRPDRGRNGFILTADEVVKAFETA